jgi:hypothetical protein
MSKKSTQQALYDGRFKTKAKANNWVQVTVWVPQEQREALKGIAKDMREDT